MLGTPLSLSKGRKAEAQSNEIEFTLNQLLKGTGMLRRLSILPIVLLVAFWPSAMLTAQRLRW